MIVKINYQLVVCFGGVLVSPSGIGRAVIKLFVPLENYQ